MANRSHIKGVDLSVRKPRRSLGTPFYKQRSLISLGIIGVGGLSWFLYELWPKSKALKDSIGTERFDYPIALQEQIAAHKLNLTGAPALGDVLEKLREMRKQEKEAPRKQSFLNKLFTSSPEL